MTPMPVDRPILVTGCPRSGTTWTGGVIGAAKETFLIYEPFNDDVGARLRLPDRFMWLTEANSAVVKPEIDDLMSLGLLDCRARLAVRGIAERWRPSARRYTPARLAARRLLRERRNFISPRRVCIKDPVAFYSSEWFSATYGGQVIVLVRHPCGVVSSYMSLKWESELEAILRHPIPGGYPGLRQDVDRRNAGPPDRLGDLILQWKLFTAATLDMRLRNPGWTFVLHDDLCRRPLDYFQAIFAKLDLPYTRAIAEKVRCETSGDLGSAADRHVQHQHARNSQAVIDAWRKKLSPEIAERVLRETAELWDEVQRVLLQASP